MVCLRNSYCFPCFRYRQSAFAYHFLYAVFFFRSAICCCLSDSYALFNNASLAHDCPSKRSNSAILASYLQRFPLPEKAFSGSVSNSFLQVHTVEGLRSCMRHISAIGFVSSSCRTESLNSFVNFLLVPINPHLRFGFIKFR